VTMDSVLLLAVLLFGFAASHSWLDCADWRFNPGVSNRFLDSEGYCAGFARRYPPTRLPYGTYDTYRYYRHYLQDPLQLDSDDKPPCSQFDRIGGDGVSISGSDERKGDPVSVAYDPNLDPDGYILGPITTVIAGQQLCWRWPSKTHSTFLTNANLVYINWSVLPDVPDPLTQDEFNFTQNTLVFGNCPEPGVPSDSDVNGNGTDRMPCGGCFTVPQTIPGSYLVQWRWAPNPGEWYASCADIIVALPPPIGTTGTPPPCPFDLTTECANQCGRASAVVTCACTTGLVDIKCSGGSSLITMMVMWMLALLLLM